MFHEAIQTIKVARFYGPRSMTLARFNQKWSSIEMPGHSSVCSVCIRCCDETQHADSCIDGRLQATESCRVESNVGYVGRHHSLSDSMQ